MVEVSIVIPTKNGGQELEKCLVQIFDQKSNYDFEVIIIDSGSTDETLAIVSRFPIKLQRIKREEFGHGKTRNLGAKSAEGKYIVYLTQDAIPANENWLEFLVKDLEQDEGVAGAYSRNMPKPNCNPYEARYIARGWGERKEVKEIRDFEEYKKKYKKIVFFSNTSSCIRKKVWEEFPFDEDLVQTEDQDWSKRVLEAGYKIVYEPGSMVYHSHNYPIKELFKKYFDAGEAHKQIFDDNNNVHLPLIPFFVMGVTLLDSSFMLRNGYSIFSMVRWVPEGIVRHFVEATGFWLGLHSKYLPEATVNSVSAYRSSVK